MSILRDQESDGTKYFVEADGKITVKRSQEVNPILQKNKSCLLYTSPSPRDATLSRMPSSA